MRERLTHPSKGLALPRDVLQDMALYFLTTSPSLFRLLTLLLNCFSLSGSVKESGIHTPTRWLLWDISLLSSWSASFLNKLFSLPQHLISWIHWPILCWREQPVSSKCFLICCLGLPYLSFKEQASFNFMAKSSSTVILEPKKINSVTVSTPTPPHQLYSGSVK